MKSKVPSLEYLEKAKQLGNEEIERLLVRMRGRFARRVEDKKLSAIEAIALQLEYEDDELTEWRVVMSELRTNEATREQGKTSANNTNINLS
ncbi:MAG: hypothetical protein WCL27_05180 [Betaproteobacteria bacterium]